MKNLSFLFIVLFFLVTGCNLFDKAQSNSANQSSGNSAETVTPSANSTKSKSENTSTSNESSSNNAAEPVNSPTKKDFVGRYVKTIMSYDNVIELREDGTGALII